MAMAKNVESFVSKDVFHENGIVNSCGPDHGVSNGYENGFSNGNATASNGHHNGVGNGCMNGEADKNGDGTNCDTLDSSESSSDEDEVVHVCPLTRSMFKQISKKAFKLDEIDGVSLPPDNKLRELHESFTTQAGDVFVVTYPKCGTIWTMQIVKLVLNNGVDDTSVDNDVAHPWIELTPPEILAGMPKPRGFKSHLKYNLVPGREPAKSPGKYIYVYRNPKDTAVSGFHQAQSLVMPDLTWEKYFERFMAGQNSYGMMLDHVLGWWEHRDADNILLVCFEDMKRDLLGAIVKIADFLECSLSPDTISRIAVQTTFNAMKQNSSANMSWMDQYRQKGRSSFMRKGSVGDWRSQFTAEQSRRLDTEVSLRFSGTELKFDFGSEQDSQ